MQLYSKRNDSLLGQSSSYLKQSLRNRLIKEIFYISTNDKFLERCFLVNDQKKRSWFLDDKSMRELSSRELGYDITRQFNFSNFALVDDVAIDDFKLFDLIELLLIFSKEDSRKSVRERFQKMFFEEGDEYMVHDFLIAQKNIDGIAPYVPFLKDKILKDRFEQYYSLSQNVTKNYEVLARISADILQFIFSAKKQKKTKEHSKKIIAELATKCVHKENVTSFSDLLDQAVVTAKNFNNQISNIRHTDKSTLLTDNPTVFKLITANNIYLAELVILSNPEEHFFSQKAIDFKNEYIQKYNIPVSGWIIADPKKTYGDINIEDIPF